MPTLTDVLAGAAIMRGDLSCPRCGKRQRSVYIQARVLKRENMDPEQSRGRKTSTTNKTIRGLNGISVCRKCADEVLDQIAQLLGVER